MMMECVRRIMRKIVVRFIGELFYGFCKDLGCCFF